MVTIKDVAKASGYSISTVSYALNDASNIPQKTKDKIWSVAKRLKYYPNAAARNLKNKKTMNIGFFVSGFSGPVYHKIYDGIATGLEGSDYNLIVSFSKNAKRMISERQIDAAIILCPAVEDKTIKMAQNIKMPVILLDREHPGGLDVYTHVLNSLEGAKIATQHLINQGRKRIAYLSGILGSHEDMKRFQGYSEVIESYGMNQIVYFGDFTETSGYDIIEKLEGNIPFDAIFCANDEMAIGLIKGLMKYQKKIPEDISVIGFDDVDVSKYICGGLSTISINYEQWGFSVAKDMLTILSGNDISKEKIVPVKLVPRNT